MSKTPQPTLANDPTQVDAGSELEAKPSPEAESAALGASAAREQKEHCSVDLSRAISARLNELEVQIREERHARTIEMATQEHRLVPALGAWLQALFHRPFDRAQFIACSKAMAWCLVPSPATATISLISILGLVVAFQANRLLMLQTSRMEEQNMLAEAQRRASLVIEATSVFEQIDREKDKAGPKESTVCGKELTERCWNQELFVPSQATLGRLAALTQALRPYRYLVVDQQSAVQPCDDPSLTPAPTQVSNGVFKALLQTSALGLDRAQVSEVLAFEASQLQPSAPQAWFATAWEKIGAAMAPDSRSARLSCRAMSPERGQLLISLHAARIDLSELAKRGATFQLADVPDNADLSGIRLNGVDLSGARMQGAKFHRGALRFVNFEGADLSGASFQTACLSDNNFGGALLQELGSPSRFGVRPDDPPPLFFLPLHLSFRDQLDSAWLRYRGAADGFGSICNTLSTLEARVSTESSEALVAEQAMVLQELRKHWLVEVTGAATINGAALLRPDAIKAELATQAPIEFRQGNVNVRIRSLQTCPTLVPRPTDQNADQLLAQSLSQCRMQLGI